jgi:predicted RNase H-like HicB family nuclease
MPSLRVAVWTEWNWWVAQCLDVDVASQGGSEVEALDNIAEALKLHFLAPSATSTQPIEAAKLPPAARLAEVSVDD